MPQKFSNAHDNFQSGEQDHYGILLHEKLNKVRRKRGVKGISI